MVIVNKHKNINKRLFVNLKKALKTMIQSQRKSVLKFNCFEWQLNQIADHFFKVFFASDRDNCVNLRDKKIIKLFVTLNYQAGILKL